MTDKIRDQDEAMLDDMFAAARRQAPRPDAALMARVLADAQNVQAGFGSATTRAAPRRARLEGVFEMLGGWAGLGGMAAASAFGLWLGMSPLVGLGDTMSLPTFGNAAALESLGDDYEYLADLGDV